jgi:hypothetical protein
MNDNKTFKVNIKMPEETLMLLLRYGLAYTSDMRLYGSYKTSLGTWEQTHCNSDAPFESLRRGGKIIFRDIEDHSIAGGIRMPSLKKGVSLLANSYPQNMIKLLSGKYEDVALLWIQLAIYNELKY